MRNDFQSNSTITISRAEYDRLTFGENRFKRFAFFDMDSWDVNPDEPLDMQVEKVVGCAMLVAPVLIASAAAIGLALAIVTLGTINEAAQAEPGRLSYGVADGIEKHGKTAANFLIDTGLFVRRVDDYEPS